MQRKAVIDLANYEKAIELLRQHSSDRGIGMWVMFVIRLLEEEPDYVIADEDD